MSPPSSMGVSGRRRPSMQRIKAKDDDLVLFRDMLTKEKDEFLLCSADELEDSLSKFKYFPDLKSNVASLEESNDLLSADCEKNDYEWLMTPPETPLFPSLDDENPKTPNQTMMRRNSSQPKRLSTSKPRSSTPPIRRSSSVFARNPSRGSSPSPKFHKSQTKSLSDFHSLSDQPPSRTRGLSPLPRRNSISSTASIVSSKEDIERKNESFSSFESFQDVYHGSSEEIFRIIMSNIPGRARSEDKGGIDAHHSISSMNSSTITFSDGSSSVADDRSEKMQDTDRNQDILSQEKMETVAVMKAQENYMEGHGHSNSASLEFSDVSLSENSLKLDTADRDVDYLQICDEKMDSMADGSKERSDAEVAFTELTLKDEALIYPLLHDECGIDNFSTLSRIGSRHHRVHSFSSYWKTRSDDSEGASILSRSNSHRRPHAADCTLTVKPFSSPVFLTLTVDSMNSGEAELLSLKPQEILISSSIETVSERDSHWVNSMDDELLSNPVNLEDASQASCPGEAKSTSHEPNDADDFVAQPIVMETSGIVLFERAEGESGNETKCLTPEEATDTVRVQDPAVESSSILMNREENAQPPTVDHPTKSTLEDKSAQEMSGEIQKISPLKAEPPGKGAKKKLLKDQSPQMCGCSVM